MNNKRNKTIVVLVIILLAIGLIFYLGSNIIPKALVTSTSKAANQKVSLANSLLIGGNLMASADGVDESVVNVFILDSDGKGIQGKKVELSGLGVWESMTDMNGKAVFKLKSTIAGEYPVSASVDGATLKNSVTVVFR